MTKDYKELFEERAAIREFDGGLPRKEAEEKARNEVTEMWLNDTGLKLNEASTYKAIAEFKRGL